MTARKIRKRNVETTPHLPEGVDRGLSVFGDKDLRRGR
jgi:hypothetical protein